jgi:phage-related protein (TIGR01555 family)
MSGDVKNDGLIKKIKYTFDAWVNAFTGLGSTTKDKRTGAFAEWRPINTEQDSEQVYAADSFHRRIADLLPFEATRQWLQFKGKKLDIPSTESEVERLAVQEKSADAWSNARIYGGAAIFLNTGDDFDKLNEPLELDKVQRLDNLVVLNRHELTVQSGDIETNINNPNFGNPKWYNFSPRGTNAAGQKGSGQKIHHTRLVIFDGLKLPTQLRRNNQYWGDSVYSGLWEALSDFGTSYGSIGSIIQDFRTFIYKLHGLKEALAAGKLDAVKARVELMNLTRGAIGAHVIDAEEEDVATMTASVAGIADLINAIDKRMQAATEIPHTILFNESPSGLGASGRAEERMWYDFVKSKQEIYLAPKLNRIFEVMFAAKRGITGGKQPEDWSYEFNLLFQPDPKQESDANKNNADSDKTYVEMGAITNVEVRAKRFPDLEQL